MRKIAYLFVGALLLGGCSSDQSVNQTRFELHDGSVKQLSDLKGDYVLMNYWASWCKPCVKEIPELNQLGLHEKLDVFAYNFDRLKGDALEEQANKFKLALPMMLNEPAPMFNEKTPQGLPATLIVNRHSGEKHWLLGPQTEASVLEGLEL